MHRWVGRDLSDGSRPSTTGSDMSDFTATEINSLAGTMLLEVLRRTHLSAPPDLAAVVAEEGHRIGADGLVLYLLDHEQRCLVPHRCVARTSRWPPRTAAGTRRSSCAASWTATSFRWRSSR